MRSFRRGRAAAFAAAYFVTNVAAAHAVEKSLWEERRVALRRTTWGANAAPVARFPLAGPLTVFDGGSTPSQPPSNFFKAAVPFDIVSAAFPYGTVSDMHEGRRAAPVVFLVQDVHGNDGAQKNIGGLLTALGARGTTVVGVEGAWVPIDLSVYHRHPSPRSVAAVADALRTAGWLSGAEWAGLTASQPISLVGIESPDLYRGNVKAARACVTRRSDVAAFLTRLRTFLQIQKDLLYSPELKNFDRSLKKYRDGQAGLGAHVLDLARLSGAESLAGVQVKRFLKALEWESRLSFSQADVDRRALMDRLTRCLGPRDLNTLLNHAVAYRAGKTTNGDFFSYLKNLCAAHRIPLEAYPAFSDYLDYMGIVQSIRRGELLRELDRWETDLANSLAKSPDERRLLVLDADAVLLKKLLENEMSPESWSLFLQRRSHVMALPARMQAWGEFQGPGEGLAALSYPHEEFCRLAIERNKALASHFLANVLARKANHGVLVAGGFHTPGLQEELARSGCSTVVITPRVEKVEGKPLDVFARDPLPFDQIFAGKPISLSPELMMGSTREWLLRLAVVAENFSENTQDALRVWGKTIGIEVDKFRALGEGSYEIFIRVGENVVVVKVGSKTLLDLAAKGKRLCDPIKLEDGRMIYLHGDINKIQTSFIESCKKIAEFIGKIGRTLFQRFPKFNWDKGSFNLKWPLLLPLRMNVVPEGNSSNGAITEQALFSVSRTGLSPKVSLTVSGNEVASAVLGGQRGSVELRNIVVVPGDQTCAQELLAGVAKEFLLLKGQGRLMLCKVKDPRLKRAAVEMFGDSLVVARNGFGRSLGNGPWEGTLDLSREENTRLLDDPSVEMDLAGSLTPDARQSLWPNEDLPALVTAEGASLGQEVKFVHVTDPARITEDLGPGFRKNDFFDVVVNNEVIGVVIFSVTAKTVRLKEMFINEDNRNGGLAKAIYAELAGRAGLLLNPERNKNGDAVAFEGVYVINPAVYYLRKNIYVPGTMEVVNVGSRASEDYFEPIESWEAPILEGTAEFDALVGPGNIDGSGPNEGKYRIHFNIRGQIQPAIIEESERRFLQLQSAKPIANLSSSLNGEPSQPPILTSHSKSQEKSPLAQILGSNDISGVYEQCAVRYGLQGRAADVGSSSYDAPAKGLIKGGMGEVSLVDHLHHNEAKLSQGIKTIPGDATVLSNVLGPESMDAVVFHRSLHHIVADKETRASQFGQNWAEAHPGVEPDIGFHIDALSHVIGEAHRSLKPGGRIFLYFDSNTFRQPGEPGFFGWSLNDMLSEPGFGEVEIITGANGVILATGVKPAPRFTDVSKAITITPRSALDTLQEDEKRHFVDVLESLIPKASDMGGVEVSMGLPLLPTASSQNVSAKNAGVNSNSSNLNEMQEKLSDLSVGAIAWAGLFALQPIGEKSLREVVESNGGTGKAQMVGAALGALDDAVRYPQGPDREKMAGILSGLIQRPGAHDLDSLQSFVGSYNHVRSVLLSVRLVGGILAGKKALLDLTALFDADTSVESRARKEATWRTLAGALSALRQNSNSQFGFVVRDQTVTRQTVVAMILKNVPKASIGPIGDNLILAAETNGGVFTDKRFSLGGLRATKKSWEGPVHLIGFGAESLVESVETLSEWGADLLPVTALLGEDMRRILQKIKFVQLSA